MASSSRSIVARTSVNEVPGRRPAAAAAAGPRQASTRVMATSSSGGMASPNAASTSGTPPAPPPKSAYRVSMFDALRFNGPAPELINGRLSMIGFLAGAWGEVQTGQTLLQQAAHLPVSAELALVAVVYGSMVPILKGAKNEAFGPFTPKAEQLNGRAAMIAFAVLLALEYKSGVCFF